MNHFDRRAFFETAMLSLIVLPRHMRQLRRGATSHAPPPTRAAVTLRLGFVEGASPNKEHRAGISVGVAEAKRAAQLFGGTIELRTLGIEALGKATGVDALLGGATRDECASIARAAEAHRALFLNIACSDDVLRGAQCGPMMFHVAPSDAMLRDAVVAAHAGEGATAVAWDAHLQRFGADTLNDRFRSDTGLAMNDDAWLAWVGVKILWEAALRARSADAARLAAHLTSETTQFDGHKGRPLSFRPWDHQLRQPLYVVAANTKPIEVPPIREDESSRDALDRLGTTAQRSTCHLP